MQTVETLAEIFFEHTPSVEDEEHLGKAMLEALMALYKDYVNFVHEHRVSTHSEFSLFVSSREEIWINFCKAVRLDEKGMFKKIIQESSPQMFKLWQDYVLWSRSQREGLS